MPQTVLLIHENAATAKIVKDSLLNSIDGFFIVDWVESCADAILRLRKDRTERIAAVLLNLDLRDSRGLKTFESLFKTSPEVPILVLSSALCEDSARLAVQHGAHDYILEDDLDSYLLPKAVRNMIERASHAEALFAATERAQVTLNSIGDAVISTDISGNVTFLNPIAQTLTGWGATEAIGRPIDEVLRIIDIAHGRIRVSPMAVVIDTNLAAKLPAGCKLIRRDGVELAIQDSAAPIHDRRGRVTGAVMVFHDVTQAQAISEKMSHLAQHDFLTDLPNRLLLNDRLSQGVSAAHRERRKLAVLFLDLDRFKHVNDSLGHPVGDELLLSVAARLVASVRGSDTVSRQGGDEFVILLSSIAHAADAALSVQKLLAAISQPHHVGKRSLQITGSVGISIYPDDGADAETLIKNADIAMLHAKESGRNNFQFFRRSMNARALKRQSIESGLRHAIERREFVLHYQAKVDLRTENLTGAEVLLRWRHSQRELISPKDFIPIAEQCGYIVPIGQWVLREACIQSGIWRDAKLGPAAIAVNISAVELRSRRFVEHVRAILEETNMEPSGLEFELTETALMQDPKYTIAVLCALKEMGIRLTLDDFGTGYSSLSYLRRFPIDALKIDRSFVSGLCTNTDDAKIVSAVINLGRSFHLQVIAEGVETRAQFKALQDENCEEGQGYYFQKPVAAQEFAKLLIADLSETVSAKRG
jgi:diguanylate cyclase (GGDEF)-like protein/PAS domain S-box-containing protein